jgi:small subunit ribosomal protein S13
MEENKNFRHLVRIVNTDLDGNKPIYHALRSIKGIGFIFANAICSVSGIDRYKKAGNLSEEEVKKFDDIIKNTKKYGFPSWLLNRRRDPEDNSDKHLLTGELDFAKDNDIKMMKKMRSYRGMRHAYGLPVRGQQTKSHFRKNKGKVMGVKRNPQAKAGKT